VQEVFKVLGQQSPSASTLTDLLLVGAGKSVVISTLTVCNRNASTVKFRLSVAIAGAVDAPAQYIFYDVAIVKGASFVATLGLTLAATDKVRCWADTTDVSFNLFGSEVSS
jgi:hypothetical protein